LTKWNYAPDSGLPLVQCVPNFSEGQDEDVLARLAERISACDVDLIDWSSDFDHNRSVFTFIGSPRETAEAAVALAREAVTHIDLGRHVGVHPRLGAIDVLPFVPLQNVDLEQCAALAHEVGAVLAGELNLPVFFYDYASPTLMTLPTVRREAFQTLAPNLGPKVPHPTAGSIAIGARTPLIAFNVNLDSGNLSLARSIAAKVRARYLGSVRALALQLRSRGVIQVSMNIIRPNEVNLAEIVQFVASHSPILETELIGAMPGSTAFAVVRSELKLARLRPEQILLQTWPGSTDL
jgi:glutamate formiminotransferase